MNNPKILICDNNDSFTFNLVQLLEEAGAAVEVAGGSGGISVNGVSNYDGIALSPGPGLPHDFPFMMKLIENYYDSKPILGVCLGHQALAQYFGAELYRLPEVRHGIMSAIRVTDPDERLYLELPEIIETGRYHSWAVTKEALPKQLKITSETEDGIVMSFKHTEYNIRGIQYHPESIITTAGSRIIGNWLKTLTE